MRLRLLLALAGLCLPQPAGGALTLGSSTKVTTNNAQKHTVRAWTSSVALESYRDSNDSEQLKDVLGVTASE